MTKAKLMTMKPGTIRVKRSELAKIATPQGTKTFKTISHNELLNTLEEVLIENKMPIQDTELAVGAKGKKLFGVAKLNYQIPGSDADGTASIGFRTANDKSMSITLIAGFSVFVCDNLVLRGDLIALKRRHTSGLELRAEIVDAVQKIRNHFDILNEEIQKMKRKKIEDDKAKAIIHDVFTQKLMPLHLMPEVSHHYFFPPHEEFSTRTEWSLHNAFTEAAKQMTVVRKLKATQRIGQYFGLVQAK